MSRTIFVHNKSNHSQTFEVHGINGNRNITVGPNATTRLVAPDHSSGAVIALHDGHEGEQAEFTKDGFEGNDFIDLSNIVGAGGNMTVAQTDNLGTAKGDPNFMQDFNRAWQHASQSTKKDLANCVHLDQSGKVVRIDPIKFFPKLEQFVRSFANGMTYIGNGTWAGHPGDPHDDQQSSAGKGNKDIIITYSDGNAMPDGYRAHQPRMNTISSVGEREPVPNGHLDGASPSAKIAGPSLGTNGVKPAVQTRIEVANPGSQPKPHEADRNVNLIAASTTSPQPHGSGIILKNQSNKACTYYFFNNLVNDGEHSVPDFTHPFTTVALQAKHSTFVPLPASFKGRVQRGLEIPATWAEFQLDASNDHGAHGDISVEQGNDGGAQIASTDGHQSVQGFTAGSGDIQTWGPPGAYQIRKDGVRAIASTEGNWIAGRNQAAIDAQKDRIGKHVYVTGGTGIPDVASSNQRLAVAFY